MKYKKFENKNLLWATYLSLVDFGFALFVMKSFFVFGFVFPLKMTLDAIQN